MRWIKRLFPITPRPQPEIALSDSFQVMNEAVETTVTIDIEWMDRLRILVSGRVRIDAITVLGAPINPDLQDGERYPTYHEAAFSVLPPFGLE